MPNIVKLARKVWRAKRKYDKLPSKQRAALERQTMVEHVVNSSLIAGSVLSEEQLRRIATEEIK